jgi:hypothetical protein
MVKHTQLLFPFILDFALSQYVTEEKPFILYKHTEYLVKTQTHISLNDYLIEHYCNKESPYFEAQNYADNNNPLIQKDGEITLWENYLK